MNALLAINPEFADKILSGEKGVEFRRSSFSNSEEVDIIYLYSTSPEMQIVGVFTTDRIVEANAEQLWDLYEEEAGIDRDRFMEYFDGVETGYAIHVNETYEFEEPIKPNEIFDDFVAPVSYFYLDETNSTKLQKYLPSTLQAPKETNLANFSNS